jgi:O-antigen/teichoic acid export membrane protein
MRFRRKDKKVNPAKLDQSRFGGKKMLKGFLSNPYASLKKLSVHYLALLGTDGTLLLLGRGILLADAFLISIYLVKKFGLAEVGIYTIANVAVTCLALLCGLGLNYSLPREALSNPQRNTVLLAWSGFLVPATLLLIATYAWVMAKNHQEILEISLFATAGFFFAITNVTNTLLVMQERINLSLIFPVINTIGLVAGIIFSKTVIQFAFALMVARALGSLLPFSLLKYSRIGLAKIIKCGYRGIQYIPTDLLALASEQSGPLILSQLISRADLGIFGLCRQVLTAGSQPGYTFLQSKYPQLVITRLRTAGETGRQMLKISLAASLLVLAGSAALGFWIYDLHVFFYMMVLLTCAIPFRYSNCFYDQVIKSVGKIKLNTLLSGVKFVVAIPIYFFLGRSFGAWGAIVGLLIIAVFSYFLYRKPARKLYPDLGKLSPEVLALAGPTALKAPGRPYYEVTK